jgi:hypothetical protein
MVHFGRHLEAPVAPESVTNNSKFPASLVRGVEKREVKHLKQRRGDKKKKFEDCS